MHVGRRILVRSIQYNFARIAVVILYPTELHTFRISRVYLHSSTLFPSNVVRSAFLSYLSSMKSESTSCQTLLCLIHPNVATLQSALKSGYKMLGRKRVYTTRNVVGRCWNVCPLCALLASVHVSARITRGATRTLSRDVQKNKYTRAVQAPSKCYKIPYGSILLH